MSKDSKSNQQGLQFNKIEYIGIFAGLFAAIGGIEQLVHTYNTQQAEDISYPFLLGAMVSALLWLIYHYKKKGSGAFIITIIALLGLIALLIMKLVLSKKKKKDNK